MMRYEEEKALLISEMKALLRFYHRFAIPLLSDDITGMYIIMKVIMQCIYVCMHVVAM